MLVVAGLALADLGFAVELIRSHFVSAPVPTNYLTLTTAGWLGALIVGVWVAKRHPRLPTGWLLTAAAITTGFGYWRFSTHPWFAAPGFAVFLATGLLPLHAAVTHGGGISSGARRTLAAGYVVAAALGAVVLTTAAPGAIDRWFVAAAPTRAVENKFLVGDGNDAARTAYGAWWVTILAIGVVVVTDRVRRWRRSPRRVRRQEAPVVAAVLAWLGVTAGAAACLLLDRVPGARGDLADFGAVALPTIALILVTMGIGWVELVEPRLSRVVGGAIELRTFGPDRLAVRALLADVLATPNVDVAYARGSHWIDLDGRDIDIEHDKRVATILRRNGSPVAAVLHDRDVPTDAVQLGVRLTAAQLDAERATALVRARTEAVRSATGELVRAGDRAAIAVSRDVLAGPLPELTRLSAELRANSGVVSAAPARLQTITASVREISHGLLPRDLEDHGLQSVLGTRADVARRLPAAVEITVFLLMVDDSHATAEVRGTELVVRRTLPPTSEAASRTTALGGTVDGTVAVVPLG
jgi:hypothetical protein